MTDYVNVPRSTISPCPIQTIRVPCPKCGESRDMRIEELTQTDEEHFELQIDCDNCDTLVKMTLFVVKREEDRYGERARSNR